MSDKNEVRAVIEGIAAAFSRLDVNRWLSYFHPEHVFIHHGSVHVAKSIDDTKSAFAPMIDGLKASGFRRSALDICNIRILGPKMAIAATVWRRLGENDKVLETFGATYTLLETPGGWKVVVAAVHDADVILVS